MKTAIPIHENRVSPRFDCTYRFLIVNVENNEITERETVVLHSINPMQRVKELVGLNIDTLICGAINEFTFRMLIGRGINVVPWVIGPADEVLDLFLKEELEAGEAFFPDGRRMCRKVRFGGGGERRRGGCRFGNKKS